LKEELKFTKKEREKSMLDRITACSDIVPRNSKTDEMITQVSSKE
jgi:hypothetical protein